MTSAEIAKKLYLSEGTVRNHLSRIYDKMGITGTGKNKRLQLEKCLKVNEHKSVLCLFKRNRDNDATKYHSY